MPWWLTIYCRESVAGLSAEGIAIGLRDGDPAAPAGVDYHALGEEYELAAADIDAALEQLTVVQVADGPLDVEIRYRKEPDSRPIVVHLWDEEARVIEEVDEAIDNRGPPDGALEYLRDCREVVGIELGISQLGDMGLVIACELARYIAQKGSGVIVDEDGEWYAVVDGGFADP